MSREEQIKEAAARYWLVYGTGDLFDTMAGFKEGAEWAGSHPHWIPIEEMLPEVDEQTTLSNDCVVVDSAGARYFGYYNGTDECWYTDDYTMILFVTHWMPLPAAPRKEE